MEVPGTARYCAAAAQSPEQRSLPSKLDAVHPRPSPAAVGPRPVGGVPARLRHLPPVSHLRQVPHRVRRAQALPVALPVAPGGSATAGRLLHAGWPFCSWPSACLHLCGYHSCLCYPFSPCTFLSQHHSLAASHSPLCLAARGVERREGLVSPPALTHTVCSTAGSLLFWDHDSITTQHSSSPQRPLIPLVASRTS